MSMSASLWGLPDPETQPEFYADVPSKRFFAWIVDLVLIGLLVAVIVPFTAFTGLFFLPFLFLVVGFVYRVISLARSSATPGMRLVSLEFRTHKGEKFDLGIGFLHTLGYTISMSMVLPQVVSVVLMLTTARAQGLSDMVLGTAAINKAARS